MVRVKLPFGGVTPEQMDAFADAVETYAPLNKGHITTRQNIQIHHIPLNQMVHMLRDLAPSGLSLPRGLRQHGPQRDRRPLGRRRRRRDLRPDPVRRRLHPLLRPAPHDPADAAEDQDFVHRFRRRPGDERHP